MHFPSPTSSSIPTVFLSFILITKLLDSSKLQDSGLLYINGFHYMFSFRSCYVFVYVCFFISIWDVCMYVRLCFVLYLSLRVFFSSSLIVSVLLYFLLYCLTILLFTHSFIFPSSFSFFSSYYTNRPDTCVLELDPTQYQSSNPYICKSERIQSPNLPLSFQSLIHYLWPPLKPIVTRQSLTQTTIQNTQNCFKTEDLPTTHPVTDTPYFL